MEVIIDEGIKDGFETMHIVREAMEPLVHFFVYAIMYILLYKCRYTYYTLFLCL